MAEDIVISVEVDTNAKVIRDIQAMGHSVEQILDAVFVTVKQGGQRMQVIEPEEQS